MHDRSLLAKIGRRARQAFTEAFTHRSFTFPPELKDVYSVDLALEKMSARWPALDVAPEQDPERPVFIFSAGWRSGSTLLQRLICSSGEIVIWGEPLGDAAVIPRLASSLAVLSSGWPPDEYFSDHVALESFSSSWIANVTPQMRYLRMAHRAFFDAWLVKSAEGSYGLSRWGLKEVRLTIEHARYLKWLYPNARFVFIYRNLPDAYRSWRGNTWASAWPGYFSWSPVAYARHWKLLLGGYLDGYRDVDGYLIKYEDLIQGKIDLDELAQHIGISHMDPGVLKKKIATPDKKRKKQIRWITPAEHAVLCLIGRKLQKRLGYR